MRIMTARIEGTAPYSQSRRYDHAVPKKNKEAPDAYDQRTWREHCSVDVGGFVCIPGMSIKMAIDTAAKKLQEKVPGKGQLKWGGLVMGGVVPSDIMFRIYVGKNAVKKDDIDYVDLWCDSKGMRNGKSRVMRRYPIIAKGWSADISLDITDDSLPADLLERYLREAGLIVGIGRFRPENGGMNGRFIVKRVSWSALSLEEAA